MESKSRRLKNIAHICRLIVGAVFIISGFVKVIDPWGTALKINEYLVLYGLDWALPASMILAIWVSGAEMMMGCMLSCKVRIQMVSIFALLSMTIFTIVTLLGATILRVEDCGCFGDAIHLTPWQAFFKNLILWPMVFTIFYRYRGTGKIFYFNKAELSMATFFFLFTMGLGAYCYAHLPLIDFLPYKVGVNITELIENAKSNAYRSNIETTLVYKNIKSGKLREFSLEDSEWQDSKSWEWVETKSVERANGASSNNSDNVLISEFAIYNNRGKDYTSRILSTKGVQHLLVVANRAEVSDDCLERIKRFLADAKSRGERVVCITSDIIERDNNFLGTKCYNLDKVNRKALLRARTGVVTLQNGTITRKRNCRDI